MLISQMAIYKPVLQVLISSTFYVRIFRTNVVSAAFSSYILALVKNSYEKGARIMLMKLTEGEETFYRCNDDCISVQMPCNGKCFKKRQRPSCMGT